MAAIHVLNWPTFQHYKRRRPPWVKLYRTLLEKPEWHALTGDASKLLAECWLLAAEYDGGVIPMDAALLAWRLRRSGAGVVDMWLQELERQGFVRYERAVASNTLASCKQVATPETETERTTTAENTTVEVASVLVESASNALAGEPVGPGFVHPTQRMSGSRLLHAWETRQPSKLPDADRARHARIARDLADHHTAQEIVVAFAGMGQLYPYSNGEPWDLNDLRNKFAKATAKARDHPDAKRLRREAELMQLLEAV